MSALTKSILPTALMLTVALVALMRPAHAEITISRIDIGLPNTAVVLVQGQYDGNEILRFKSAIADIPAAVRIIAALNSPGGRVDQGFELGKFFFDARIPTIILAGHECASSCTNAFFGGRDPVTGQPLRILASGGKLGFHNFRSNNLPDKKYTKAELEDLSRTSQQIVFAQLTYLKSVDAPIKAIVLSLGTPHEDVNWLSEADALQLGVTILNREMGRMISPSNIASRTR